MVCHEKRSQAGVRVAVTSGDTGLRGRGFLAGAGPRSQGDLMLTNPIPKLSDPVAPRSPVASESEACRVVVPARANMSDTATEGHHGPARFGVRGIIPLDDRFESGQIHFYFSAFAAAASNSSRAQVDVLPSAALSSLQRSSSVKQIRRIFACRSLGFFGGRPVLMASYYGY